MRNENCIFCKILNGDIPAAKLYEDEDFAIILDVGPASFGHALIIPKDHYANLFEMPEEMLSKCMKLAKVWGDKLVKALNADRKQLQGSLFVFRRAGIKSCEKFLLVLG